MGFGGMPHSYANHVKARPCSRCDCSYGGICQCHPRTPLIFFSIMIAFYQILLWVVYYRIFARIGTCIFVCPQDVLTHISEMNFADHTSMLTVMARGA